MENRKVSVVSKFDDICRGFSYLINDSDKEFLKFTLNQDDCRKKWQSAENEVVRLQSQLNESNKVNSKLELQIHHITVMLKDEIKVRQRVQQEKKNLEKQLAVVREIVTSEKNLRDDTREKLAMLSSTGRFSKGHFDSPCDRLDTINELNSTGSILASFDITGDRSDDEMELSMVRSSRAARMKRASDQIHMPLNSESTKRRRSSRDFQEKMDMSGHERLVATTTVTVPKKGPILATSIIEAQQDDEGGSSSSNEGCHPISDPVVTTPKNRKRSSSEPGHTPTAPPQYMIETSWELPDGKTPLAMRRPSGNPSHSAHSIHTAGGGPGYLRTMASGGRINQRQHTFTQKTIIKPENCLPCGNRIKFGKTALKCVDCRGTCHVDCKLRMPMPCVQTVQTPSSKGFVGAVADYAPHTSPMIPALVIHCVNEIERRGMDEVGLYRVSGTEREVKDLKERLLRGKWQPMISQVDIHVVAGSLKLFFRSLREPIITFTLWESFVRIADINDEMDVQTTVYSLVPDLPQPNRDTLAYLILHLQRVAESANCKMPTSNIAKIFGPTIIGNSCPEPDPETALKQLKKQYYTMEKLLQIPSDYWSRYVEVEDDITNSSTPVSSRHPGFPSSASKSIKRGPQFFTSPNL